MNAQVSWRFALDGQHSAQPDQPFGILERFASWPVSFDRRKTGGLEKLEAIITGLADPCGGNLAGRADCSHGALLSAKDSPILPQPAPLVKFRDPSHKYSNKGHLSVAVGKREIEITINKNFEGYTKSEQDHLLRAFGEFLKMGRGIKVTKKRRGSIKITLQLPSDKAEELFWAIKSGVFEEYGVVDAGLKDSKEHTEGSRMTTVDIEEIPLEEARNMGRGPWMDPILHNALKGKISSLSSTATRIILPPGLSPVRMKNDILRVATELRVPVTVRRVRSGLLFWRSTDEDIKQAKEVALRLQAAKERRRGLWPRKRRRR